MTDGGRLQIFNLGPWAAGAHEQIVVVLQIRLADMDDSLPFLRNGYQGPEVHGTLAEGGIRTFRGPDPLETDSAPPRRIAHEVDRHTGRRTVGGLLLKRRRTLPTDKVNAIVDMGPEVLNCEIACGRQ